MELPHRAGDFHKFLLGACRRIPSAARLSPGGERAIFSSGKDGEAGDVGFIVDAAGCSQAKKGPLEARSSFLTEPSITKESFLITRDRLNDSSGQASPVLRKNSYLFGFKGLCKLLADRLSMNSTEMSGSKQLENMRQVHF